MVTANILQRVFHISYNGNTGTAFALDVDERQYLITAAHCVGDEESGEIIIEIMHDEKWHPMSASVVGSQPFGADIAVLALPQILVAKTLSLPIAETFYVGQEVYFLGFPHGRHIQIGAMNSNYPMPFVKRGIISGVNDGGNPSIVYLDGINNPGFSGGPVVVLNPKTQKVEVISVVSSYHLATDVVMRDGVPQADLTIDVNTGIVETFGVMHAREIARSNPIGRQL